MAKKEMLRPGQPAPESGQYGVFGPRGGSREREITAVKDKPLPPTREPGEVYMLIDKTKH